MPQNPIKRPSDLYHEEQTTITVIKSTITLLDKAVSLLASLINSHPKKGLKKQVEKKLSKTIAKHFSK